MLIAVSILSLVLAVILCIALGALVEMFEQIKQIRVFLEIEDTVSQLSLPAAAMGSQPSTVGLPALLDSASSALVVVLSETCATCRAIAREVQESGLPDATWLMLVPSSSDGSQMEAAYDLGRFERVFVDSDRQITSTLEISVAPAGVRIEGGALASAQTIPSVRRFKAAAASLKSKQVASGLSINRSVPATEEKGAIA